MPVCINLIKNNFRNFFEKIEYNNEKNVYIHYLKYKNRKFEKFGERMMIFNHDTDCPNTKDGYLKFKIRYENRINNFKAALESSRKIIFILNLHRKYSKDERLKLYLKSLKNALESRHNDFHLICINLVGNLDDYFENDKISLIKEKNDVNFFENWFDNKYKFKLNKNFKKINSKVKNIIKTL